MSTSKYTRRGLLKTSALGGRFGVTWIGRRHVGQVRENAGIEPKGLRSPPGSFGPYEGLKRRLIRCRERLSNRRGFGTNGFRQLDQLHRGAFGLVRSTITGIPAVTLAFESWHPLQKPCREGMVAITRVVSPATIARHPGLGAL